MQELDLNDEDQQYYDSISKGLLEYDNIDLEFQYICNVGRNPGKWHDKIYGYISNEYDVRDMKMLSRFLSKPLRVSISQNDIISDIFPCVYME